MKVTILIVAGLLLTACSSPLSMPKPPSFQDKVTHSADWSALASRAASHFVGSASSLPTAVCFGFE
jgi:outer membrane biogenesis lipoprotein LolB